MLRPTSVTIGVPAADVVAARDWYARVLGRPPDHEAAPHVFDWVLVDRVHLQLFADEPSGDGQTLRLGVDDLDAAIAVLREAGAGVGPRHEYGDWVAFCEFDDPFGNRLSLYQVLQ
ncbi:MAG TPA: VOC family protein [Solirubrobacteraceae bacterium]